MDSTQFDKLLKAMTEIQIAQAVLYEKMSQMNLNINKTNERVDHANTEFTAITKRVVLLERISGGVVIAVAIVGALLKFKVLT